MSDPDSLDELIDKRGARRPAVSRRALQGPVAKAFQKMNILLLCEDYAYAARMARHAEAQNVSLSLFWSVESFALGSLPEFDAAMMDAALWPEARAVMLRAGTKLGAVVLLDGRTAGSIAGATALVDARVTVMPRSAPPDEILVAVSEAAQQFYAARQAASAPAVTDAASGALPTDVADV